VVVTTTDSRAGYRASIAQRRASFRKTIAAIRFADESRPNDVPPNRDTDTDLVPGVDTGTGDRIPSRRPTAQLKRVRDGGAQPDRCIGN
jgi:hypothetical protein